MSFMCEVKKLIITTYGSNLVSLQSARSTSTILTRCLSVRCLGRARSPWFSALDMRSSCPSRERYLATTWSCLPSLWPRAQSHAYHPPVSHACRNCSSDGRTRGRTGGTHRTWLSRECLRLSIHHTCISSLPVLLFILITVFVSRIICITLLYINIVHICLSRDIWEPGHYIITDDEQ